MRSHCNTRQGNGEMDAEGFCDRHISSQSRQCCCGSQHYYHRAQEGPQVHWALRRVGDRCHLDAYQHHSVPSPGAEPMYSDDIQGNGEAHAEGFYDSNFDNFGPRSRSPMCILERSAMTLTGKLYGYRSSTISKLPSRNNSPKKNR